MIYVVEGVIPDPTIQGAPLEVVGYTDGSLWPVLITYRGRTLGFLSIDEAGQLATALLAGESSIVAGITTTMRSTDALIIDGPDGPESAVLLNRQQVVQLAVALVSAAADVFIRAGKE